uniref:Uncharacterized protein n=1 Tax=Rhizophora mucronata TaxID=61149 RepID=A0A2P2PWP2_RHIMU
MKIVEFPSFKHPKTDKSSGTKLGSLHTHIL